MQEVRAIVVVLAVDPNNQHARRLRCLRRLYFGPGDTARVKGLTSKQRRVIAIWRRFGDCAYTEPEAA